VLLLTKELTPYLFGCKPRLILPFFIISCCLQLRADYIFSLSYQKV